MLRESDVCLVWSHQYGMELKVHIMEGSMNGWFLYHNGSRYMGAAEEGAFQLLVQAPVIPECIDVRPKVQ